MRDPSDDAHALAVLESSPQRPVADEREAPLAEARECVGEAHDVLALRERTDAEERGTRKRIRGLVRSEALRVDAHVDHIRLAPRLRQLRLQLAAQVVRDGDDGRGALADAPRQCGDAAVTSPC